MSAIDRAAHVLRGAVVWDKGTSAAPMFPDKAAEALHAAGLLVDDDTSSLDVAEQRRLVALGRAVEATKRVAATEPSFTAMHRCIGWNNCLNAIHAEAKRLMEDDQ